MTEASVLEGQDLRGAGIEHAVWRGVGVDGMWTSAGRGRSDEERSSSCSGSRRRA